MESAGAAAVFLFALGAGTASAPGSEAGGVLIHFDLMGGLRLPEHEEPWVEAEPGASWLQMDDYLRTRGWGLAEDYTLFGAYDAGGRAAGAEAGLRGVFEAQRGHALPVAGAHRAWGERFFPVAPSHPTPSPTRELVHLSELPEALAQAESRSPRAAVQGTVARSGRCCS